MRTHTHAWLSRASVDLRGPHARPHTRQNGKGPKRKQSVPPEELTFIPRPAVPRSSRETLMRYLTEKKQGTRDREIRRRTASVGELARGRDGKEEEKERN